MEFASITITAWFNGRFMDDGTDGDDESEEEDKKKDNRQTTPGLSLVKEDTDGREKLAKLLETPSENVGKEKSPTPPPADWVEVRKKSKEERKSIQKELDFGEYFIC